ncbi:MAG: hypothetical protein ABI288_01695, partial [Ginsengibacter sp.]
DLPINADVKIITEGGWDQEVSNVTYPIIPALIAEKDTEIFSPADLHDSLQKPFRVLSRMRKYLATVSGAEYERAYIISAIASFEAYHYRRTMEMAPGYFRPNTTIKQETILKLYTNTAFVMYKGFKKRMEDYSQQGDLRQKRMASYFFKVQK